MADLQTPYLIWHTTSKVNLRQTTPIVHWDQRKSGRTYFENRDREQPEVSLELILQDMDEVVDYARNRFSQDEVIVLGYSWGTIVGTYYVQEHPDKVAAFISVSQIVNVLEGLEYSAQRTRLAAEQAGNSSDAQELADLIVQLNDIDGYCPELFRYFHRIERLAHKYLSHEYQRSISLTAWTSATSPTINMTDLRWFLTIIRSERFEAIQSNILEECFIFDARSQRVSFDVPTLFISGDSDWITPVILIRQYYTEAEISHKELSILEGVGHNPLLETPDKVYLAIKSFLEQLR